MSPKLTVRAVGAVSLCEVKGDMAGNPIGATLGQVDFMAHKCAEKVTRTTERNMQKFRCMVKDQWQMLERVRKDERVRQ